jgi:hypothetical protein
MKRQLLLLLTFALSAASFAQSKTGAGIRVGFTSAGLKGDAVSSLQNIIDYSAGMVTASNRTGLYGGGYVSVPLGGIMSLEPALYYAQKGYELKGALNLKGAEFLGVNAKAALTAHYLDLPVVLKANLNGFQVFVGPQVSYLAKADFRTTAGVLGFNVLDKTMDATQQFNRWDAGVTGGIGYQFSNGLNITAAYDHGLSKVDANKSFESYNRSVKVGIGFSF